VTSFGYDPSPLHRLWRLLTADFSLGTWFSVPVRMYWAALIVMPLVFLRRVPSDSFGEAILMVAVCFIGLFAIIWTHEMGHIAAGWHYRIRSHKITLGPLGGLAHMNAPAETPKEELVIALAGPATHLIWLAVLWPIEWLMPDAAYYRTWYGFTVWYLVVTNQSLLLFNLVPIFPLDGGRALRAILSLRVHPNRATIWVANIGIGGGALLILMSLTRADVWSSIGMLIGIMCIMRSIDEKRMARHVMIYQRSHRTPWEVDPDAWQHGGSSYGGHSTEQQKPGWLAQRRAARAEKLAAAKRSDDQELEARVDAVLARVSKVGLTGLSADEKAILQRASQRRRGAS